MAHSINTGAAVPGQAEAAQGSRAGCHPDATYHHNVRAAIVAPQPSACNARTPPKPWRNVQARAALAGWDAGLIETDEGRPMLVATRWARTITFEHLAEAEAWLRRVEGKR